MEAAKTIGIIISNCLLLRQKRSAIEFSPNSCQLLGKKVRKFVEQTIFPHLLIQTTTTTTTTTGSGQLKDLVKFEDTQG